MKTILFFIMTALISLSATAGTRHPSIPDSRYIEYAKKFDCIKSVEIEYHLENKEEIKKVIGFASCVVIAEDWVLTAAHISHEAKNIYIKHETENRLQKKYLVDEMIIHKDFVMDGKSINGNTCDIALCHVANNPNFQSGVELVDIDAEVLNKLVAICGFGVTGDFNTGAKIYDGKKRAGSNVTESIVNDIILFGSEKNEKPTVVEMLVATGDSGGGVFLDGKLLGIISFIASSDSTRSDYGDSSGFVDIRKHKRWIHDTLISASKK